MTRTQLSQCVRTQSELGMNQSIVFLIAKAGVCKSMSWGGRGVCITRYIRTCLGLIAVVEIEGFLLALFL